MQTTRRYYVVLSGEGTGPASYRGLRYLTDVGVKRVLRRERAGGDRWARAFYHAAMGDDTVGIDAETGEARGDVFIGDLRYWGA